MVPPEVTLLSKEASITLFRGIPIWATSHCVDLALWREAPVHGAGLRGSLIKKSAPVDLSSKSYDEATEKGFQSSE